MFSFLMSSNVMLTTTKQLQDTTNNLEKNTHTHKTPLMFQAEIKWSHKMQKQYVFDH